MTKRNTLSVPARQNTDRIAVTCKKCGAMIGHLEDVSGQQWLKVNGVIVRSMHGVCALCGDEFHWSLSDRMLSELVNRVMEMRKK